MMTAEDKINSLHHKMNRLQAEQERQKAVAYGAGSVVLAVYVVMMIIYASEGVGSPGGTAGLYSGATMLFENAGGYVAAAIAAFMVGVVVTVICLKQRVKHEKEDRKREEGDEK